MVIVSKEPWHLMVHVGGKEVHLWLSEVASNLMEYYPLWGLFSWANFLTQPVHLLAVLTFAVFCLYGEQPEKD